MSQDNKKNKQMKKKEEEPNDAAFREKLLEKYAQDEKLEKGRRRH